MKTRQLNPRPTTKACPETAPSPEFVDRCPLHEGGERPPPHLTPAEAGIWTAAEQAKRRGDRTTYCRMRRALLLCQAARYEVGQP